MFENRLQWFALALAAVAVVLVARLAALQFVHAADYEALSERLMTRPVRYLAAPRGDILDRAGRTLVADEPSNDICVHYGVLAGRSDYLYATARELRRRGVYPPDHSTGEIVDELRLNIADMWRRLAVLTDRPVSDFVERAEAIRAGVERVRAIIEQRSGFVQQIAEETQFHPLLEAVDDELALTVRLELERHPWLRVVPGARRVARDVDALVHIIGRTGPATREHLDHDPLAGDELRALLPGDRCGTSGVERVADAALRGARGRMVEDMSRTVLERVDPVRGGNVRLAIDSALQRRVLELLGAAVEQGEQAAGGAAVVIDVTSSEVLALVSYPTYSYAEFPRQYDELLRDTRRNPLLFRAVAAQYPPGSICKAITLVGGLSEGVVGENTRIHCTGALLKNNVNAFRCWIYNQHAGLTHDATGNPAGQNAEDAVRNSCNIYFYTVGEKLGAERLCDWFSRLGLGRSQGTGLVEEVSAIVPNRDWLQRRWNREHQPADAWNHAIGQGEVTCTPLQAANVAAAIARGRWEPVRLVRNTRGEWLGGRFEPTQYLDERALRALRAGMWRVVNERGGTAFAAKLDRSDYELCGKTGSAQTVPAVLSRRYTLEWPDGRREEVVAVSASEALDLFPEPAPKIVGSRAAERFPALGPDDKLPSHAWFIGYTQPRSTRRGAAPQGQVYAISVQIEFGGGGGRVAGPIAKQIAELLLTDEPR